MREFTHAFQKVVLKQKSIYIFIFSLRYGFMKPLKASVESYVAPQGSVKITI